MNDAEHLAWVLSCNYQRTLHPIYRNYINRFEEVRRRQRQFICNTLNNVGIIDTDVVSTKASSDDHGNNSSMTSQRNISGLKVVSPKPTAVHISILKIQAKT